MSLFNIRALKTRQLTSKLAVAGLLASGLTVAPFFAGADGGYVVPAGADVIQVVAVGGSGGGIGSAASGGKGCELSASFAVVEGDVFSESLGGNGGNGELGNATSFVSGGAGGVGAEGRNGGKGADYNFLGDFRGSGSGGGGATSVYLNGTEVAISAGGGGGGTSASMTGGSGCASNTLDGGAGAYGLGGGGATTSSGGIGGSARGGDGLPGQNGTLGVGGAGSDATSSSNGLSSGGGGGYYGGGSSPSWAGCCSASGGGAGSSWAAAQASGIKAATGKAATVASAQVTYYAVDFPTQTLAYAEFGSVYNADLSATFKGVELSNAATAIWTVAPALPAGLSLNATTGTISGTPTEEVNNNYEFKAAWKSGSDVVARSFQTINLSVGPPPPTPGAPTINSTSVLNTNVSIEWTPPTRVGTSAISDYRIEYSIDGGNTWSVFEDGVSAETSVTLPNLLQLTDYQFRVTAINDSGAGPASDVSQATTGLGVPGQVQFSSVHGFAEKIEVNWNTPNEGGAPISDYIVQYSPDSGDTWITVNDGVGTNLTADILGLPSPENYLVRVAAVNELGTGDFSYPYEIKTRPVRDAVGPTPTPTPTETSTPTPTPTPTKTPKPTPTPTKKPTPKPTSTSGSKSTSSPTPTSTPTPTETLVSLPQGVLDVLAKPYRHKGAMVELKPLKTAAFEDGVSVPVTLKKRPSLDGYILEGRTFGLELAAVDANQKPVELNEDGKLVLTKDRFATFSGSGFAPNSPVQVWLFSDPTNLKRVTTDENGEFTGSALIPADVPVGEHTVQLNGVTEDGDVRSVALGVVVEKPAVTDQAAFDWAAMIAWIVAGLLAALLVWWFVIARRRREEQQEQA